MESLKKTLLVAAALLVIIMPLLSTSSLSSANLYFIVNIIIIVVAAEAGVFSFFLVSARNEKPVAAALSLVSQQPMIISKEKGPHQSAMVTQVGAVDQVHKIDPSIFFIEAEARYDGEEVGEVISGQELFQKAEIFIGNFYKQLNIQRDESWKKLHDDFSQKKKSNHYKKNADL